jgi:hypothetical protein
MTSRIRLTPVLLTISLLVAAGPARKTASGPVTTASLFEEMIDLERLTRFPAPAYKTVQFSSYDRRSRLPGGPDWFANDDGFGGEPIPGFDGTIKAPGPDGVGEYLVADVKGPGAVVRLWSAAISGKVKVWIDDLAHPLYDGDAGPFFQRTYDCFKKSSELDRDVLSRTIYQRDAAYAPLPFRRRLRIVWIGKLEDIHFYHAGVRLYEPGTEVVSFSPRDLVVFAPSIRAVLATLADPDGTLGLGPLDPAASPGSNPPLAFTVSLAPHEKREVASASGPKAVSSLALKVSAGDMDKALRTTVLQVLCDGAPWGQVQAPVGDFFGAAPGVNPYASLPFSVRPDGTMVCRFVMPFRDSLKITFENTGDAPVNIAGAAALSSYVWDDTRSMHFRARWRASHGLLASNTAIQDLPFLIARGQGVYVGTTSYIMNPCPIPTSYGDWWGEGDEKVFVDADRTPSIFGTGSEDYYNYSWSAPDIFACPYCGQPRNDGPGNRGFVTNFRWHILDPLPFKTGLAFFMELNSHEPTPGLSYARIGYHYARPGLVDDHLPLRPEDLRVLELPDWEPAARMGARNFTFVAAEKAAADPSDTILRGSRMFAGGSALVWFPGKNGDVKDFRLNVAEAGRKMIHVAFVRDEDSGRVSALVDGRAAAWEGGAASLDIRVTGRTIIRMIALEALDLAAGNHTLSLRFDGADSAVAKPEVALDFIGIQKIER